jgi:L-threonylcarbamoyladenylate synthase
VTSLFFDANETSGRTGGLIAAANAARAGELAVFPTDTVYGLGTDAFSGLGTHRIREAKGRGRDVPIPVLISEASLLNTLGFQVSDAAMKLCEKFWPGGLTVIVQASPSLGWDLGEAGDTVALRVPDHEFVQELLRNVGPMAVSSANTHGRPPASTAAEAYEMLGTCPSGAPSTIVDLCGAVPAVVRVGAIGLREIREVVADTAVRRASS